MGQIRTFVAIEVASNIRNAAFKTITRLSAHTVDYNWVEKENLHITLNFLGDVDDTQVPDVCKRIKDAVTDFGSFDVSIRGLGCFPNLQKPRVAWIGVEEGSEELIELNHRIGTELEKLRFPRERNDYRPHLTLGRLRRGGRFSPVLADAIEAGGQQMTGSMLVDKVVVYSSFLDRAGPTYTPMSRIDLV